MIIDFATSRLYDVDILSSNRVLNLKTAFTNRKLAKEAIARGDTQGVANSLDKFWVRIAAENHDIADHLDQMRGLKD